MTNLLKKWAFIWNNQAQKNFQIVKLALISVQVLALPDFSKTFIVKANVSQAGISAVILQKGYPHAFISRALGPKWQNLYVYKKKSY